MIPYLQLDNLSKSWGDNPLFENISLTINQGEKVALIAKNGAGKTTLMNIIFGHEVADNGKVFFNNDIRIGYLRQLPELNPDERVWNDLKNNALGRQRIDSPKQLYKAAISHLRSVQKSPRRVRSYFQNETTKYAA